MGNLHLSIIIVVSPLGGAENLGYTETLNLKLHNSTTRRANPTKLYQLTHPEIEYKPCKNWENRARDTPLQGVYIPHFWSNLSEKVSFWGPTPFSLHRWGEIWHRGGKGTYAKFRPHRCNVLPLRGAKPQYRPLSKLNTGALRFAQCCR